ncbi:MAG: Ku protein [Planctomycetota bacterium]
MAPRSSWKGFLRLSLVSVPVKAYSAGSSGAELRLNQLHKPCNNRIRYRKSCPEHGEVPSDEIVSGYEYSKGRYVVIEAEEMERLRTQSDRSVTIDGFIPSTGLDPVYHAGRTYYLVPDGAAGQKPYELLLEGMAENDVSAIAQVVLAGKEQVVLLRIIDRLLAMTVLNTEKKVKSAESFHDELTESSLTKEERELTNTLIQASLIQDFDFSVYKDKYTEKLTKLVQMKVDGEQLVQVPDPDEPKILNLMDALKKSVAEAASGKTAKAARKKMAPSARSKKKAGKKKTKIG